MTHPGSQPNGGESPRFSSTGAPSPRLVLDTNTVLALWLFEDPSLATLRNFIESTQPALLSRADALEELHRVLAYRNFDLPPSRQEELLAAYQNRVIPVPSPAPGAPPLPPCRDRDDQKFLEIAQAGGAQTLITRDKALLRLARHRLVRSQFAIVTPEFWVSAAPSTL